jgi:hypothetical protein
MYLKSLKFNVPNNPFGANAEKLSDLIFDLKKITKGAGKDNTKFKLAWAKLFEAIQNRKSIEHILVDKVDIRVLGFALTTEYKDKIRITENVLNRIDSIVDKPSSLFIQDIFQYYLNDYNKIDNIEFISQWLIKARKTRKVSQWYDEKLLCSNGAKWVAELAISEQKDFDQISHDLELDQFQSGQFMESAQRIYYVEQLKNIPVNQPHELLIEVQKPDVFGSRFDDSELLGHQVLKILIEKAPSENIHESWLNVIMAIAGDPRIPKSHQRYITWWSHIPNHFISKVRGWLSRLDLKLFLEALDNFSASSNNVEMQRMYPARKNFLEGIYDKKLIINTRLYMSRPMAQYLRKTYKKEHLPDFSLITDDSRSIIYVDIGNAHLVEGIHSCYLRIYKSLDASATVFDYAKPKQTYYGLTSILEEQMANLGHNSQANITHNPTNFSWQRKAIETLKYLNVPVTIKDVLTPDDYRAFVRKFGAN